LVGALGDVSLGDFGRGEFFAGLVAVDGFDIGMDIFAGEGEGTVDVFAAVEGPCSELK
jgi:hypothetical protein